MIDPHVVRLAGRRSRACIEKWPDAEDGDYNPYCCRFPKPCSPYPHPEAIAAGNVTEADVEPGPGLPWCSTCKFHHVGGEAAHLYTAPAEELSAVPGADNPRLELVNIRRLVERHGIEPADGNGELRSTVAMVEEALVRRPPV